ncbi:exodeoxyribonuclease VII large subunit [Alphaproteobacteria bacterium]|nr:exodeoxyribonuclease VII large subunit [Alphaproteobacteria bacterium]
MNNIPEYTVSQLNRSIKDLLEENFAYLKLVGETGSVTIASSGHVYFSIKENDEVISCICWKGSYENLQIKIEEGTEYNFYGRITSYSKFGRSVYQLIIDQVEYSGTGSILKLIEDRKKELSSMGFFDDNIKKKLPKYPKLIGVLTSASGSVIHDIIHRISERFPITQIQVYPISVQGKNSHIEIIDFLNLIENHETKDLLKPDLIIFARGGGSLEELMPFNEPDLIKRVFNLKIPNISAIGHETDYTLLDYVSDLRAPTPTAAAEIAVPDKNHLSNHIKDLQEKLNYSIEQRYILAEQLLLRFKNSVNYFSNKVKDIESKLSKINNENLEIVSNSFYNKSNLFNDLFIRLQESSPKQKISEIQNKIQYINFHNKNFVRNKLKILSQKLYLLNKILNTSSIERNLKKGYAILKSDNKIIKSVQSLKKLEFFDVTLKDGLINIKKKL